MSFFIANAAQRFNEHIKQEEIDRRVRGSMRMGHSLYGLVEDRLKAADPSIVFTQGKVGGRNAGSCCTISPFHMANKCRARFIVASLNFWYDFSLISTYRYRFLSG